MALRRRKLLALANGLVASSLMAGCSSPNPAPGSPTPSTRPPTDTSAPTTHTPETPPGTADSAIHELTYDNTAFGVNVLHRIANDGGNQLFSPYSVAMALGMTSAGARGETRTEMHEVLQFPFGGSRLHDTIRTLHERIIPERASTPTTTGGGERTEVPLQVVDANALWGQEAFPWAAEYLDLVERFYGAGLHRLDFASNPEQARETINEWVAETTRDKITDLLPPGSITTMTRLVLTNAVYFQALWEHPFTDTEDGSFTNLDGSESTVPMMAVGEESFRYAEIGGHQLVDLPYRDGNYGFVVVLPPEGGYDAFESTLTGDRLWRWLDRMEPRVGTVRMPKFGFRSGFQLSGVLKALGMRTAFTADADFSGMATKEAGESMTIDEVYHQTFIEVDEKGTEAAAATAVVVAVSAVRGQDPFDLTIDRPFLFLIRERQTGAVLFLGRVVDVTAATPDSG